VNEIDGGCPEAMMNTTLGLLTEHMVHHHHSW